MDNEVISSGIAPLDEAIQGLRLGDNVVWRVANLADYKYFAEPFARHSISEGRDCYYLRFAPHEPIVSSVPGVETIELNPKQGFDAFTGEVYDLAERLGEEVFYVFDNLSALVEEWATDELLANFFQVTCPFLYELRTIAYFALSRQQHPHSAVARLRDTPQVLLDVYRVKGQMYVHPIKVLGRYSPHMFVPHAVSPDGWTHVVQSGDAATVTAAARKAPLGGPITQTAPWERVYRKLLQFVEDGDEVPEQNPEIRELKSHLCRMVMGSHPGFDRLADRYFTLDDLLSVRNRLIGSGRVGGKAAGMLLARAILRSEAEEVALDYGPVLERHDSFYIGSDVFFTFLVRNQLFRDRLHISHRAEISPEEFEEIGRRFQSGTFPAEIVDQFRSMIDYYGQAPIIVRSSSLLEDSFGNAFAGKYHSEFLANQGSPEERLESLMAAIKRVYASALSPDALAYRKRRGLLRNTEQMAVLVQRVSGMPYRNWFFPALAGVAFSRNMYAWTDRIDPKQGVIRLVFGLGTRAVERVGGDYPRMIPVSAPFLRPETGLDIAVHSQHAVDVLDMTANREVTLPLTEVLRDLDYPGMHYFVSQRTDDDIQHPVSNRVEGPAERLVLTFENLLRRTDFVSTLGGLLARLDSAYGMAVDVEFTAHVRHDGSVRVNLLQCRPMTLPGAAERVTVPSDLPAERVVFRTNRMLAGGEVHGIRHIVYVHPAAYAALPQSEKRSVGRAVGKINERFGSRGKLLTMGPGRWGSSNLDLGVNVGYADISNAAVLVEIARSESGQVPEVSYGTHFFLDLVEAGVIYLPVYPDEPESRYNEAMLHGAPSVLSEELPELSSLNELLRVIDVPAATGGMYAHVVADPDSQQAVCYLE